MKKIIGFMVVVVLSAFSALSPAQETSAPASDVRTATVKVMLTAGSYTYLLVSEQGNEVWLATAPNFVEEINEGDVIEYVGDVEMQDFHSKALDRTFASLWFVGQIRQKDDEEVEAD